MVVGAVISDSNNDVRVQDGACPLCVPVAHLICWSEWWWQLKRVDGEDSIAVLSSSYIIVLVLKDESECLEVAVLCPRYNRAFLCFQQPRETMVAGARRYGRSNDGALDHRE